MSLVRRREEYEFIGLAGGPIQDEIVVVFRPRVSGLPAGINAPGPDFRTHFNDHPPGRPPAPADGVDGDSDAFVLARVPSQAGYPAEGIEPSALDLAPIP